MYPEDFLSEIYLIVAIIAATLYFRGNNYKRPAGILFLSTLYYTQGLFFGWVDIGWSPTGGSAPHWGLYFFYSLLLLGLTLSFRSGTENTVKKWTVFSIPEKYKNLPFFFALQSFFLLLLAAIWFALKDTDLTNKNDVIESKNIFFFLTIFSSWNLLVLSAFREKVNKIVIFYFLIFFLYSIYLGYRGILVEACLISILSNYFSKKERFFLKKKIFFICTALGFIILAPAKYFLASFYRYIETGSFSEIHFDDIVKSFASGNEGASTIALADAIMKSNITLPHEYLLISALQHLPFIRQIFNIPRQSFNEEFQSQIFGYLNFGVGSSSVAEVYVGAGVFGLILLLSLLFYLVNFPPKIFYFRLMYLAVVPGYLFFFHRIDWDQILFHSSIQIYVSFLPFLLVLISRKFNKARGVKFSKTSNFDKHNFHHY